MRARHRLSKLLLRHGIVYSGGQAWTGAHEAWLRRDAVPQLTRPRRPADLRLRPRGRAGHQARRDRLDTAIAAMAADSEFTPLVRRLGCLRGICTLTGFALAVEIGDWHRFTGNTIGSFVGLVPTEYSSGQSRGQGSITKTGNTHARRLLVEAAWHHRARYLVGKTMRDRWDLAPARRAGPRRRRQPATAPTLGHVHARRKKRHVIANVAIARELAGWCWSLAVLEE